MSAVFTAPMILATPKWDSLQQRLRDYSPKSEMGRIVKESFKYLPPELAGEMLDSITRIVILESKLHCVIYRGPCSDYGPEGWAPQEDWGKGEVGVTSRKLITNNGVAFLVDAWQNSLELEIMKYHGIGTGATAEAAGDTALVTESTTALNPDSTRATGTLTETSAPVFATVGVNTVDASVSVAEHGLFSQAATGGGVLWDRSLTGTQALSAGDSLQTTYSMTASAGG